MTIREKIHKLEVLEEIVNSIECSAEVYREDAKRYRDKAAQNEGEYFNEMAEKAEAKAEFFIAYRDMLVKHEIW